MKGIKINVDQIPAIDVKLLSATFLEAVQRFYEDPENLRRFEAWKHHKEMEENNGREKKRQPGP